jgi:hypothetical protein
MTPIHEKGHRMITENTTVLQDKTVWSKVRPLVLKTIIGSVIASGAVALIAVVAGEFGTLHWQLFLTILLMTAFALLAWYDADVSSKRSHNFALVGVCVSLYLLLVGLIKIWAIPLNPEAELPVYNDYSGYGDDYTPDREELVFRAFGHVVLLFVFARAALLHSHLMLMIQRKYNTPILLSVAKITLVFIGASAALLSIPQIFADVEFSELYWRLVAAVIIINVLGTILIPLTYALFGPKDNQQVHNGYIAPKNHNSTKDQLFPSYDKPQQPVTNRPETLWSAPGTPAVTPVGAVTEVPTPDVAPAPVAPVPAAPVHNNHPQVDGYAYAYAAAPDRRKILAWPRYIDDSPLPALPNGLPDYSQVEQWPLKNQ